MIRMTRSHRRDLIRAHPQFRGQAHDALFLLADAPDALKLHAAFAHLYPSAWVEIEPLGGSAFALTYHDLGTVPSFSAGLGAVGFACSEARIEFETPYELAGFAARHIAQNRARLAEIGPCDISHGIGDASVFYAPSGWTRAENEARCPEFAEHNAKMAAYHFAFAEELFDSPKSPTTAYRYNMAMVEKLGGLRPELAAPAIARRSVKGASSG